MQQEHRDAIQSNFTSLVERTDLDSVVTALYEKGVFSEQMIEPYRDTNESERERKRKLYRDITRRGPHAFGHLMEVLTEMGHWDLLQDLAPEGHGYLPPRNPNINLISREFPPPLDENNFVSISTQKKISNTQPILPQPDISIKPIECTEVPEFEVIKSTEFIEMDHSKPDVEAYYTRGRRRGVLLILSYVQFQLEIEEQRRGAEVDAANLKHLFSEIGFKVVNRQNLTKKETLETLESCKGMLEGTESVFVVVSSHGYETGGSDTELRCSDGKLLSTYDIIEQFNNKHLPELIGVPKVFVFQTCRGSNEEYVWRHSSSSATHMAMPMPAERDGTAKAPAASAAPQRASPPRPSETPLYSDILIAHSTLPRFASRRDPRHGSWYIQVLCEVFAGRAHDCHVDKLFTLVDQRLRARFKVQTSSVDRWGFNKRLYLHPGLYE